VKEATPAGNQTKDTSLDCSSKFSRHGSGMNGRVNQSQPCESAGPGGASANRRRDGRREAGLGCAELVCECERSGGRERTGVGE